MSKNYDMHSPLAPLELAMAAVMGHKFLNYAVYWVYLDNGRMQYGLTLGFYCLDPDVLTSLYDLFPVKQRLVSIAYSEINLAYFEIAVPDKETSDQLIAVLNDFFYNHKEFLFLPFRAPAC